MGVWNSRFGVPGTVLWTSLFGDRWRHVRCAMCGTNFTNYWTPPIRIQAGIDRRHGLNLFPPILSTIWTAGAHQQINGPKSRASVMARSRGPFVTTEYIQGTTKASSTYVVIRRLTRRNGVKRISRVLRATQGKRSFGGGSRGTW